MNSLSLGPSGTGSRAISSTPISGAGRLFQDINELRRQPVNVPEVENRELAKLNDTCCGDLVRNKVFEVTTLSVIVLNAIFIGYDADYAARWGKPDELYNSDTWGFPLMENLFAIYFTFEVGVRFLAFKTWVDLWDAWWIFDSLLVLLMVVETYILAFVASGGGMKQLSVLRLLRLLRVTRMGKLMRYFPDLQVIVRGMLAAARSVACTAVLLVLMLYVFSIIFTSVFHQGYFEDDELDSICGDGSGDSPQACAQVVFGSLGKSMRHLFIMGTILDDITKCVNTIRGTSEWLSMLLVFMAFVVISSFTTLNMLIGILCEVVQATSEGERLKNTASRIREAIRSLFAKMDKDHNGQISREEFLEMRNNDEVREALKELNVKPRHFRMYADLMFQSPDGDDVEEISMSLESIADMILHLRPGSKVNALDFASFSRSIATHHKQIRRSIEKLEALALVSENNSPCSSASDSPLRPRHWRNVCPPVEEHRSPRLGRLSTLKDLDRVSEQDIISELQRRVSMNVHLHQASHPHYDIQKLVEAFQTLCAPQLDVNEDEWSRETYSC